jgi:hypothetical protein
MGVVLTEEYNVMVNSDKLIGTTEHVTLYARCRSHRCRYNGVGLSTLSKAAFDPDFLCNACNTK